MKMTLKLGFKDKLADKRKGKEILAEGMMETNA